MRTPNSKLHAFAAIITLAGASLSVQVPAQAGPQAQAGAFILPTSIPGAPEQRAELYNRLRGMPKPTPAQWRELVVLAIDRVNVAKYDDVRLDEAEAAVARAQAILGKDPEIAAVGANLSCMRAGDPKIGGLSAMMRARGCTRKLDGLERGNPDHLGVRLQRGIGALRSPKVMKREDVAVSDLEMVDRSCGRCDPSLRAFVATSLGDAYVKVGRKPDALRAWGRAAAIADGGYWANTARARASRRA